MGMSGRFFMGRFWPFC